MTDENRECKGLYHDGIETVSYTHLDVYKRQVTNTWNIVMGVFDMAQSVVAQAAGIIGSDASIDISSVMTDLEPRLMEMDLGPLFGLWFQSLFIGITMWALYICIFIVIYGRMIEIYRASRSAAFHPKAVCGHFGNPALASR